MSLTELKRGQTATVVEIPEGDLKHQLLRFGLAPGVKVNCKMRIPFGPMILGLCGQEIAVGREIACRVKVK